MRRVLSVLLSGFLAIALSWVIAAQAIALPINQIPNPRNQNGWVTDLVNLFSSTEKAELNAKISAIEKENGVEIGIVTVPNALPYSSCKELADTLFDHWGIGKKSQDNGLLMLICKGDRRVEIETGYGIEPILPDTQVRRIVQSQMIPDFKRGKFAQGTLAGTQALITALSGNIADFAPPIPNRSLDDRQRGFFLVLGLIVVGVGGMGSVTRAIAKLLIPQVLEPEGNSRVNSDNFHERIQCAICREPMERLDQESTIASLSEPQKVARRLGSIHVDGWQCSICQPHLIGSKLHLRTHVLDDDQFHLCPVCQELTMNWTFEVLESATISQPGKRLITEQCCCCNFHDMREEMIPALSVGSTSCGRYSAGSGGRGGSSGGFGGGGFGGGGFGGGW